ncbi:MAG: DUF4118 domain-containing protein [Clostridiales bacterium]|nr:DUF4118 domain-containing protein [Clostridiales bacterium]
MKDKKSILFNILKLFAIILITTVLGMIFRRLGIPETNIVVVYILAVLLVARFTQGYIYGIFSSVAALLCFNFFFTEPYHTLQVYDPGYLVTFAIMLATAFVTSTLTTKEKLLTEEATEMGLETQTLYMLSSKLSDAADIETVIKVAAESASRLLQTNAGCIYVGKHGEPVYIQQLGSEQIHRNISNLEEIRGRFSDFRTEYLVEEESFTFPINGRENILAVLRISRDISEEKLTEKKRLLHSMMENVSLALERIEVTIERIEDRQKMERERERANLLRAISHDLRTPLSGIMGTSEMLMDMTEKEDKRQQLLRGIYQDADWLKSLVENILSLTRLQDGQVVVRKEMEAMEEIVECAISHVEKAFPDREIQVKIPEDFHLVPMDARLIEQVITNLLENAVKHTTPEQGIEVSVTYTDTDVVVSVKDEGEGIGEEDIPNLFQIFYTSKNRLADVKKGIGLGLTICETVVKAHGGSIKAHNRKDKKGAEFIFCLPYKEGEEADD